MEAFEKKYWKHAAKEQYNKDYDSFFGNKQVRQQWAIIEKWAELPKINLALEAGCGGGYREPPTRG